VHVTADSVPKCLSSLRARLHPEECIQTVYKRGYRLSAEVVRHSPTPNGGLPRLAIMPFTSGYAVPEHLGMTIAEETTARLVNMRHPLVSVLARDSVFTLAKSGHTAQQVGEALKAGLVLIGTLRAQFSQFRLRAEMIRVEDGAQIWVEDILVAQSKVGGLESELIRRLAFRLGVGVPVNRHLQEADLAYRDGNDKAPSTPWSDEKLSISAVAAPANEIEGTPEQHEAYETFLRAHYEWQSLTRHRMQDGLRHLQRATELDPSLVAAQLDIVRVCVIQSFYGFMSPTVAADLALRAAKSIPDFPQRAEPILPALGWISFHVDHDLPAALQAFTRSAHLPHAPETTRLRVMFDLGRHRFSAAIATLRAALREDPFSPWLHARLAWSLHLAQQAEQSVEQVQHGLTLFPDHEGIALYGALILAFNGQAERGVLLAERLAQREPYFDLATAVHAYTLACADRKDEARGILERLQWLSRERFVLSSFSPAAHIALGDHDAALAELRTAAESRCPWFFQTLADPRLKPLHGHPEFDQLRAILTRMEASVASQTN
jgi:TolB-like protein